MQRSCTHCGHAFEITQDDVAFLQNISPTIGGKVLAIPAPTHCPDCRQQRRLAFRNERHLYHRKCDKTGKQIISMYSPDKPYIVYDSAVWWSDAWDPIAYGQDVDFSRPFFEQFAELLQAVPRQALHLKNVENSDFNNHIENTKNTYLSVDVAGSEDIYFSRWIIDCRTVCDCYQLERAELCYESLYSVDDFRCSNLSLSDQCSDSHFLFDCQDCKHCFLCWNLRHREYCFENVQYTKEEYEKLMSAIDVGSSQTYQRCRSRYVELLRTKAVHRSQHIIKSEECVGDFLYECKNVRHSFNVINSQDCRYCYDAGHMRDCADTYESAFDCERQYESHACNRGKNLVGCSVSYDVSDACYCDTCHNSDNLFGCVGLRRHHYCILNKQYTKEEYEDLVPRIVAHLQSTGEWGEFFPMSLSPFGYNETVAQDYYPLERSEAMKRQCHWHDEPDHDSQYLGPPTVLADNIHDVPDALPTQILRCEATGKYYKIIPQELAFYRQMHLPAPRKCPEQRHRERMSLCNPWKLWQRQCMKCGTDMRTTYAPERPEIVYCEKCYLSSIY